MAAEVARGGQRRKREGSMKIVHGKVEDKGVNEGRWTAEKDRGWLRPCGNQFTLESELHQRGLIR